MFFSTSSSIRCGLMLPSLRSRSSVIRAISRRTGLKPDRTTVSASWSKTSWIPVALSKARMLRPSWPMIRPFTFLLGRAKVVTVRSAEKSDASRSIASDMILRASSSAVLCASYLISRIMEAAS